MGEEMNIVDSNVFLLFNKNGSYEIGTDSFLMKTQPYIASFNLHTKKITPTNSFSHPYTKVGAYYPSILNITRYCLSRYNKPLIGFMYSPDIFEWDYQTNTSKHFLLGSRIVDSISPLAYANNYGEVEGHYGNISYDPYRKLYYTSLLLADEFYGKNQSIMVFGDENMEYFTEIHNPRIGNLYPTKDYLICAGTDGNGAMQFICKKMVKTNQLFDVYIAHKKDSLTAVRKQKREAIERYTYAQATSQLINYAKDKLQIQDSSYTLVTLQTENNCPACFHEICSILSLGYPLIKSRPLYMIIGGISSQDISYKLGQYDSVGFYSNIHFDTLGISRQLDGMNKMGSRLTIVRNNKIQADSVYDAFHIIDGYIPDMAESFGLFIKSKGK